MTNKFSRIDKAVELVEKNRIEIILEDEQMIQLQVFSVNSNQRQHVVTYNGRTFHCTCKDYQKGHAFCYHCLGCSYFLRDLRREGQRSFVDESDPDLSYVPRVREELME